MRWTTRRTLAAAAASATALAVLFPVLHGDWFVRTLGAVAVVAASGLLCRAVHVPRALQPIVGLAALALYLLLAFVPETLSGGLPTGRTVDALQALVRSGQEDIRRYAPPVVPHKGLVLMTAAGVGLVALLVDLLAVTYDRVLLAGLPLLALFAVPSAVLPHGTGSLAFLIGASGWLLLLLEEGGDRMARWGGPMRSTVPGAHIPVDDGGQARVGRRLGAAALGVAVLAPVLVPGLDHQLLGNGSGGPGAGRGQSPAFTFNPITRLRGELTLPEPRQLLVYSTDDPQPDYLRMTTLDTYTPEGWKSSQLQADPVDAQVRKGIPGGPGENGPTRQVSMRVATDSNHLDVHWLPLPYGPRRVRAGSEWLWDTTSQTAFSASRSTKNLPPYTVDAARPVPTRDELEAAGTAYPVEILPFVTQPQVSVAVATLTAQITKGARTPYDKAVAIQQWFRDPRNGFVYDTDASQPGPGQDPLEGFLTGKHGFCEQYATAMAVLLRLASVPARVAVGFTRGEAVEGREGTYRITTLQAHAWPEAFFPGTGWMRFEPTPGATASEPDYSIPASQPSGPGPDVTPAPRPTQSVAGPTFRDPDELLRQGTPNEAPATTTASSRTLHRTLLGLTVVVLLAAPSVATWFRRRARVRRQDPLVAWDQLRDDVQDAGLRWEPSASPRATLARLAPDLPPEAAAALERLALAVEVTRYAPPGRLSQSDVVADETAVRRALLAAAPRAVRWRARLLTPSTLRWAGHAASERVADLLDAVDHGISWIGRPLRRVLRPG